jgi:predicted HTH domain antitoxin
MSTVAIELPDVIRENLQERQELSRFILEAVAVEGYRQEALSRGQVGEMLGLSFWQTEEFLRTHGVYLHYDVQDFEQDLETAARIEQKRP